MVSTLLYDIKWYRENTKCNPHLSIILFLFQVPFFLARSCVGAQGRELSLVKLEKMSLAVFYMESIVAFILFCYMYLAKNFPALECLQDDDLIFKHYAFIYFYALMALFLFHSILGSVSLILLPLWIYQGCKTKYDDLENRRNRTQNRLLFIDEGQSEEIQT